MENYAQLISNVPSLDERRENQRRVKRFQLKTLEYRLSAKLADQQLNQPTAQTSGLIQLFQALQEEKSE